MNHRQKLGYTALGAIIMLIGMTIDNLIAPPVTAQHNGTFDEIQCSKLTVVNANGRPAIILSSNPTSGSEISLYDQVGRRRVIVRADTDGTFMKFNHPSAPSLTLTVLDEGAGFIIQTALGKELIHLSASDSARLLNINNPDGKPAVTLDSLEDGWSNSISLYNKDGGIAFDAGYAEALSTAITLYDDTEETAITLSNGEMAQPFIIIEDAGQRVWSAP